MPLNHEAFMSFMVPAFAGTRTAATAPVRRLVAIYAGNNGFLDDIPTPQVQRFQDELRDYLRAEGTIYNQIKDTGDLPDELAEKLNAEIEKFKNTFNVGEDSGLI